MGSSVATTWPRSLPSLARQRVRLVQLAQQGGAARLNVGHADALEVVGFVENVDRCPIGHPRHDELGELAERPLDIQRRTKELARLGEQLACAADRTAGQEC